MVRLAYVGEVGVQKLEKATFDMQEGRSVWRHRIGGIMVKDSSQTQEFAHTLGVTQKTIAHRLKSLGMIYWLPCELKSRWKILPLYYPK